MFKVQVKTPGDRDWVGNGLTFPTWEEAEAYAVNLASRWLAVREWRVVEVE